MFDNFLLMQVTQHIDVRWRSFVVMIKANRLKSRTLCPVDVDFVYVVLLSLWFHVFLISERVCHRW